MKILILTLLLMVGCADDSPKYKYEYEVQHTGGTFKVKRCWADSYSHSLQYYIDDNRFMSWYCDSCACHRKRIEIK